MLLERQYFINRSFLLWIFISLFMCALKRLIVFTKLCPGFYDKYLSKTVVVGMLMFWLEPICKVSQFFVNSCIYLKQSKQFCKSRSLKKIGTIRTTTYLTKYSKAANRRKWSHRRNKLKLIFYRSYGNYQTYS